MKSDWIPEKLVRSTSCINNHTVSPSTPTSLESEEPHEHIALLLGGFSAPHAVFQFQRSWGSFALLKRRPVLRRVVICRYSLIAKWLNDHSGYLNLKREIKHTGSLLVYLEVWRSKWTGNLCFSKLLFLQLFCANDLLQWKRITTHRTHSVHWSCFEEHLHLIWGVVYSKRLDVTLSELVLFTFLTCTLCRQ